jgi:hypothetical protein
VFVCYLRLKFCLYKGVKTFVKYLSIVFLNVKQEYALFGDFCGFKYDLLSVLNWLVLRFVHLHQSAEYLKYFLDYTI